MHAVLYGRRGARWAMTERGRSCLRQEPDTLAIGPSRMVWDGTGLTVNLDEVGVPLPRRIRGRIRLAPDFINRQGFWLDADKLHAWRPIGPCSHVEVALTHPRLTWTGRGYFDTNGGRTPLESAFLRWDWSRANLQDGAALLYDTTWRNGGGRSLALRFDGNGSLTHLPRPEDAPLSSTFWRVSRGTQVDRGQHAAVRETLTDAPFYARSLLSTHLLGEAVEAMHETLDMDRFCAPWVQVMLPFRMPRRVRPGAIVGSRGSPEPD